MKSNQEELHLIETYLQGNLNKEKMKCVQKRISEDPTFAAKVTEVKLIREAAILSKKKSLLAELKALEDSDKTA